MNDFVDKETFIKLHGFDPDEAEAVAPKPVDNTQRTLPTLANAARGVAVGAVTAIPDILALPGVIGAAAGAGYDALTSDAKFADGFAKRVRVEDADVRTKSHVESKISEWKAQDPTLTDAEIPALLKQYSETPAFERFNQSLLSGGVGVAARFKDGVRDFVGDERTDKQRSWVDSALEVIGSSVVGVGPATAAKAANTLGKTSLGAAALNNPVAYGALRTAEAVTPLTLPLTPGNVALNSAVGIGIDQGLRYAMGDTTVLSQNDAGLGGLAAVATAAGTAAAVVAVARGKSGALSQLTKPLDPNIAPMAQGLEPGTAVVRAGPESTEFDRQSAQPSMQFSGSVIRDARDTARIAQGNFLDEFAPAYKMIQDQLGKEAADDARVVFSNKTGAGGRDEAVALTNGSLRPLQDALSAMSPDEQQKFMLRWTASNAEARNVRMLEKAEADLQAFRDTAAKRPVGQGLTQKELEAEADLIKARDMLVQDDPATRRYMPDISRQQIQQLDRDFRTDPAYAKLRPLVEKVAQDAITSLQRSGMVTSEAAQLMRNRYPYFLHMQQDPLDGAQGIMRQAKAFMTQFRDADKLQKPSAGNRGTLDSFNPDILTDASISRITIPLDPMIAMNNYLRNVYHDAAQNTARKSILRALTQDANGQPSKYMQEGNIRIKEVNGRYEFTPAELSGNPKVNEYANRPELIRVYYNGNIRFYEVGDPSVAALLRFEPKLFTGWAWAFKKAADMFKANTTGVLSPVFAPINALYDTGMGLITRNPERAFGPMDTLLRRIAGEQIGKHLGGRIFDPTAYAALPWHTIAGMGEVMAIRATRAIARDLAQDGMIKAIAQTMGVRNYEALVQKMLLAAERSKTAIMLDKGVMHSGAMNTVNEAMTAFDYAGKAVPASLRSMYDFYRDIITSIHGSPKRQFWAQNWTLLEQKYGVGKIPQKEIDKLIYDTRALSGDMTRQAANDTLRTLEAAAPYLAPMRNGMVHLGRSLSDPRYVSYTYPRLMQAMTGMMASFYMMSNWNQESRDEFWKNTPEWMRYRFLHLPTPELLGMWHRGENPPFDAKLIYKIPIGPDLAPIIAGTSAFLRGIGVLPNGPEDVPITGMQDLRKMLTDMVAPVFPPLLSAPLAAAGVKIDLADSGGRGMISMQGGNPFQRGPQTETASPLGEMESSAARLLGTLFGSNGTYIARSYDAMMHAAKFDQTAAQPGQPAPTRETTDYMAGLKAATTTFFNQQERRMPDLPGIWKGSEKQYVATPAAEVVREAKQHMQSIIGMRDYATGKRSNEKRNVSGADGMGVVQGYLRDPGLLRIADEVRQFDRSGDFRKLKDEYSDLAATRRAVENNYTAPKDARTKRVNELIDKMQSNLEQQRYATMYLEQTLEEKYADVLNRHLDGETLSIASLDRLMRKSVQGQLPAQ
jgi:hypothetical protein